MPTTSTIQSLLHLILPSKWLQCSFGAHARPRPTNLRSRCVLLGPPASSSSAAPHSASPMRPRPQHYEPRLDAGGVNPHHKPRIMPRFKYQITVSSDTGGGGDVYLIFRPTPEVEGVNSNSERYELPTSIAHPLRRRKAKGVLPPPSDYWNSFRRRKAEGMFPRYPTEWYCCRYAVGVFVVARFSA